MRTRRKLTEDEMGKLARSLRSSIKTNLSQNKACMFKIPSPYTRMFTHAMCKDLVVRAFSCWNPHWEINTKRKTIFIDSEILREILDDDNQFKDDDEIIQEEEVEDDEEEEEEEEEEGEEFIEEEEEDKDGIDTLIDAVNEISKKEIPPPPPKKTDDEDDDKNSSTSSINSYEPSELGKHVYSFIRDCASLYPCDLETPLHTSYIQFKLFFYYWMVENGCPLVSISTKELISTTLDVLRLIYSKKDVSKIVDEKFASFNYLIFNIPGLPSYPDVPIELVRSKRKRFEDEYEYKSKKVRR